MGLGVWPVALCVATAVVFVLFPSPSPLVSSKDQYAFSLVSFVSQTKDSKSKVAIAYNDCLDLIVKGVPVLKALGISDASSVVGPPSDFEQVHTLDEVVRLFTMYHKQGSAVERHVTDGALFDRIVEEAKKQPKAQYFAGGNAALMANGLVRKGSTVLLGGPVGGGMRKYLLPEIAFPSLAVEWKDEVHLILEFERQEEWSGSVAPRANRMILTHDVNNINIKDVMDSFGEAAIDFGPDMVVLTGFHMLGSEEETFRETQVLKAFSTYDLIASGKDTPLHVELASMGSVAYWVQLLHLILLRTHSIGLNELELFSVYSALGGHEFNSSQFVSPDPKLIIATIAYVFEASKSDVFQRVHFHCLQFHIVALRQTKKANGVWPRERGGISVAAGALTTTQNACFEGKTELILGKTDELDLFIANTIEVPVSLPSPTTPFSPKTRSVSIDFQKDEFFHITYPTAEFFLSPILVCKFPKKTVGLGDSISSAGLAYSL